MHTFNEYWTQRDGWLRNFQQGIQFSLHSNPKPRDTYKNFLLGDQKDDDSTEQGKQTIDQPKGNSSSPESKAKKAVTWGTNDVPETGDHVTLSQELQAERMKSALLQDELHAAQARKSTFTKARSEGA